MSREGVRFRAPQEETPKRREGLDVFGGKRGCAKTPVLAGCPLWTLDIECGASQRAGRMWGWAGGTRGHRAKGLTVADPE